MRYRALLSLCLGLTILPVAAATLVVAEGESIQNAIDRAAVGDTVSVEPGHYTENLHIDKPLTLSGRQRPTLSGGLEGDVIRVRSPRVVIDGLIIRDSGGDQKAQNAGIYLEPKSDGVIVRNCDLTYNLFGLWIETSRGVQVLNNLITGKRDFISPRRGNGIQLYNASEALIVGNRISFVRDGIYVDVSHHAVFRNNRIHNVRYGTHYMNSHNNVWEGNESYHNRGGLALMMTRNQVVRNNRAWGNSDHGIMLRTIQDSVIENNVVAGNARGFFIYDAEYNTLRDNLVVDNTVGVHLWAGSYRNVAEGNDFVENRTQIKYVASRDEEWGGGTGNFWSNYSGWDRDGDGRGDVRYAANDMVDRLGWKFPTLRLLLASPAVQTLKLVAQQFPLLRAPSIVDPHPRMKPKHSDWSQWRGRYFPTTR
ncbi:nitrous oxide reductase family maturation protein NosD [Nitrogeniibacter aestuarii]|uniref:nitrous oxide reductase family maturation protein NosD n=1 Tax=Nitrogeniibacter aestuarii TaxID=2815343 RepID=UPI001E5DD711|nr:nitrous oxide reductase family maturation protein NosD [Nitrogeniibacter aestuarii]